ncbi:UTRA domain-containing protein, partial [bacterium]|nr:UTRA domain-containing protein [bacterium]
KVVQPGVGETGRIQMEKVAQKLSLSGDAPILFIERLRLGDDEPLVIERSYFPAKLLAALLDYDIEHKSIYTTMEKELNIQLGYAEQSIEATVSNPMESQTLQIHAGSPMLLIKRLACSVAGDPIEYAEDLYRADRLKLRIFTKRGSMPSNEQDSESLHRIKPTYSQVADE